MVRTKSGPLLWTREARLVRPSQRVLRTDHMVATAHALWVDGGGRVTRVDTSGLTSDAFPTQVQPQWKTVVRGDPVADRVVVSDEQGCHAVLDGSSADLVWRTCDWEILALSPDGRLSAARSLRYRTIDIVDVASSRLLLRIDTENNPVSEQLTFDHAGRLYLRVGDSSVGMGFLTVEVSGECWFSTGPDLTLDSVAPNRR